jgi:integrase
MSGGQPIASITDADILAYVAKDRSNCTNATVNRRLQMLGRAIRHMGKFYKADIPELNLKSAQAKEPREIVRELTMDEQRRLFEHLPIEYHPIVNFALMTGARVGSITSLLWKNIDMENREISFWVKGDERLTFPINKEVAALLSAVPRSKVLEHRKYVFTRLNKQTLERQPIDPHGGILPAAFRKALADADIEGFRFHDLRHTFATRLLRKTQNIKLVSKLLGHSNIETTTKYAHVLMDDMRQALDSFSVMGDGPKPIDPQNNPQTKCINI